MGLSFLSVALLGLTAVSAAAEPPRRPNFVVILGEGQGWSSTSIPMDDRVPGSKSDLIRTPNLERLAAKGARFACCYAASPRCTPSRAALLTGKSPARLHMTFVNLGREGRDVIGTRVTEPAPVLELPETETTCAELLGKAGYATAHFGKWHVGRVNPTRHGFDENDGANGNEGPDREANPNPKQAFLIAARGVDFMNRQAKAGKPFLLEISHYPGRGVEGALPATLESVRKRAPGADARRAAAAAVAEDMDKTIGLLLDRLDELGIADNTYVIYTADHGLPGRRANEPLNHGKGSVWEGGLRVPLIIRGPGVKAGACLRTVATHVDLLPTIAELSGVRTTLPAGLEGGSLAAALAGGAGEVKRPREELVFHFPHYDADLEGPASAIRLGDFKLIRFYETGVRRLFDLSKDLAERRDLAGEMPARVGGADRRLSDYLKSAGAQMPAVDPNAEAARPAAKKGKKAGM